MSSFYSTNNIELQTIRIVTQLNSRIPRVIDGITNTNSDPKIIMLKYECLLAEQKLTLGI